MTTSAPDRSEPTNIWFEEAHPSGVGLRFKMLDYVYSARSPFQKIDIVETQGHGKLLAHDGMVMITEKDEFIYHDMITHVPMFVHPNPKNVLVIGGGDGGTVREVLRHASVEKCTMVEIDEMVVRACQEHIPQTSSELKDPRVELVFADGVEFVKSSKETFDVIIVDSSDPIGPATPLFNESFYKDVYNRLDDNGIVVSQGESPYYELPMQQKLVDILSNTFPKVHLYNYTNLSYPGGIWSFTFATKGLCPFQDFDPQRVLASGLSFQLYNPQLHLAAFALPEFLKEIHGDRLSSLPQLVVRDR